MRILLDSFFKQRGSIFQILLLSSLIIISCSGNKEKKSDQKKNSSIQVVTEAERFTVDKKKNFTTVTIINPWQGANNINQVYTLVKRGSELPDGFDSSMVIFVPLKKVICMSTTHVAMISVLGEENSISGVSGTGYVFSERVIKNIERGLVADVGYEANLNKELILKISPDLVMMYGIGSESASYVGKLKELGVKVVFNGDYLETNPLGKAEWIKLFGALYCKENLADSIFRSEVDTYNRMKNFIRININNRPKVMLGLPFKETWYISPGNSFISKLISDAGGDYIWHDTESSVSMPVGIENVYMRALKADFWLNIGTANSLNDISSIDKRLTELPCFKRGNAYNNNKRITPDGGNDYWENGTVYPHLILKDIASIIHPGLFTDNQLFFYHKLF